MKYSDDGKQKIVHIAWTNSDLTEGRGHPVLIAICETEAAALRKAKNAGVMGLDGYTTVFPAIFHAGGCGAHRFRWSWPPPKTISDK